jgi:hypothetical protein
MDINDQIEILRKAVFVLFLIQPSSCPKWVEGQGDCKNPECEFCKLQILADKINIEIEKLRIKRDMKQS